MISPGFDLADNKQNEAADAASIIINFLNIAVLF